MVGLFVVGEVVEEVDLEDEEGVVAATVVDVGEVVVEGFRRDMGMRFREIAC